MLGNIHGFLLYKYIDVSYTSSQTTIFYEYQNGYRKILHYFPFLFYSIFPIKAIPLHLDKTIKNN